MAKQCDDKMDSTEETEHNENEKRLSYEGAHWKGNSLEESAAKCCKITDNFMGKAQGWGLKKKKPASKDALSTSYHNSDNPSWFCALKD